MMRQYLEIHKQAPDALLFFRVGDFYEMFFDDAITASKALDLVLTGKDCGLEERAPMCGVPYHAVDIYIGKLVEQGFKIAVCEQVSEPNSRGIVDREITRIVTSGTVTDPGSLSDDENNYIMSIYYNKVEYGVAYADISTGDMYAMEIIGPNFDADFLNMLNTVMPSEVIVNGILYQSEKIKADAEKVLSRPIAPLQAKYFVLDNCEAIITRQLNVFSINAAGLEKRDCMIKACGALLSYLKETQKNSLSQISKIEIVSPSKTMLLDASTKRNLELTEAMRGGGKRGSLLAVLDSTVTAIGARTLRKWVTEPMLSKSAIAARHNAIEELLSDSLLIDELREAMGSVHDIERMQPKITSANIRGKDLLKLKRSIEVLPKISALLGECGGEMLAELFAKLDVLADVGALLSSAVDEECSNDIADGTLIKAGFSAELDELKAMSDNIKTILSDIEAREREQTGIKNLKIKYNKVFGYFIEVTKSNLPSVPAYFQRRQTLVNAERFITDELKEVEEKLYGAHDRILEIEATLYAEIVEKLRSEMGRIKATAETIGILDAITSFAFVSLKNGYVRPNINDNGVIEIIGGRHPVVEDILGREAFIPNDTLINEDSDRMAIITGPNMAGKSTYIRQVAVITLMNQIGCFVPAERADICIVDRIFTRVGASDDLASGQSTFMVEMGEVSNILKYATSRSLVILDEVGRGTSTLDGLSIAWAVAEFLSDKESRACKCLFATHYHELTQLENLLSGVVNYSIETLQNIDGVVFLHKIRRGSADKSYGIEVARLAGLPEVVLLRAEEILQQLESEQERGKSKKSRKSTKKTPSINETYNLLNYRDSQLAEEIRTLPLDEMTPIEVMSYVAKLKRELT